MKKNIDTLTSFRFFAALGVFYFHVSNVDYAGLGVSFFFVLSGFILTYTYFDRLQMVNADVFNFYTARFARIYPLHLITFSFCFCLFIKWLFNDPLWFYKMVLNLLLLQSYVPNQAVNFSYNGVSWSISCEFFFYFCFPFLLLLVRKVRLNLSLPIIAGLWLIQVGIGLMVNPNSEAGNWGIYIFPLFRIAEFIIGMLICLLFRKRSEIKPNFVVFTILEVLTLCSIFVVHKLSHFIDPALRSGIIYVPFIATMILVYSFQCGVVSKILQHKFLVTLGEISFAFYMIHQLVIRYDNLFITWKGSQTVHDLFLFVISVTISYFVYTFYEIPMRNKIRGWVSLKKRPEKAKKEVYQVELS